MSAVVGAAWAPAEQTRRHILQHVMLLCALTYLQSAAAANDKDQCFGPWVRFIGDLPAAKHNDTFNST